MNTVAIFDIGKTNKKFFLFNEQYKIVLERSVQFAEISDEDGFACDDLPLITQWVKKTIEEIAVLEDFTIKAINFSAYGASFVNMGQNGEPVTPLYNYLKPFPPKLNEKFYHKYGGENKISVSTASPVLGNLNSGMQLYRLRYEKPAVFEKIAYALHLPQYISYLITGKAYAEITSIGCHTGLWDFTKHQYHHWVYAEKINEKFPTVLPSDKTIDILLHSEIVKAGIGLHDSSSALIPYLTCFPEPFILISTGTWCISFNPFNDDPITIDELQQDCLCFLEYHGRPVKASRLFTGNEHEQQVKRLAKHFNVPSDYYKKIIFNSALLEKCISENQATKIEIGKHFSAFTIRTLESFGSYEEAYHQLIYDIMQQQKLATSLIFSSKKVTRIFVDGRFAQNPVFMNMLADSFQMMEVFAASVSQASAIGAALAIHEVWNSLPIPSNLIELIFYPSLKLQTKKIK